MTKSAIYSKTLPFAMAVSVQASAVLTSAVLANALLVATMLLSVACGRPAPRSAEFPATDGGTESSTAPKVTEPKVTAPSNAQHDEVEQAPEVSGHYSELPTATGPALLWVPSREVVPLPLLVVTHGAGGSAEWHCDFWVQHVTVHAFVLCLRGKAMNREGTAFYFPEHHDLAARIRAGLEAFKAGYAAKWAAEATVYAGYSQGATMGALALPEMAKDMPLALLIEGGYEQWSVSQARRFQQHGGQRAFIACGTRSCERGAGRAVRWLTQAGIEAASKTAAGAGHSPAGPVGMAAVEGLLWLTRDEIRWQGLHHQPQQ